MPGFEPDRVRSRGNAQAFSSAARKERSDAARAGGASRTRTSRWGHHLNREARCPRGGGLFVTDMPGFEPERVRIPASSQGPWAKNSKYEYCYQFSNAISCHQKAIQTPGVLRRKHCKRLSAKYLDICCATLHILQKDNATGLVTVLIFDVFCPRPLIAWANQLQNGLQSVPRKQKAGARAMRTPAQYRDDMSVTFYT